MLKAAYRLDDPETKVYVGDCRRVLHALPENSVDLIFADPPFNWDVPYGEWDDGRPRQEYLRFTEERLRPFFLQAYAAAAVPGGTSSASPRRGSTPACGC